MEFSCVGLHDRIFLCVLEESFQKRLIFSFSVWNMISMKDAPHIREEYAILILSTYIVTMFETKCYRQEIWNSIKYRATRESSFKSENWLWRTFYFSFTVFLHDVPKPWILPIFWIFLCVCILLWWGGICKWRHWNFLLAHLLGSRLCHHFEKTAILQ